MLEHHADAKLAGFLRVAHLHRFAIDKDLALVRLYRSIDDLHQRGLARAVFAKYGVYLARAYRQ
ncbi:hypothetical protein D3C71_2229700 [compost metagenome]